MKTNQLFLYYYLYKITNWYNGKIYIGVHGTNNIYDSYMGSGVAINRAIKKYGKEYFTKEIISFHNSLEEAYSQERIIVNSDFVKDPMTYNLKNGGSGGYNVFNSEETKKNMSNAQVKRFKDNPYPEETKQKQSKTLTGRPLSDEHKKAISKGNKGKIKSPMPEETKQKLRDANKDRIFSEEWKYNLSEAGKNRPPMPEETKQKLRDAWKKRKLTPCSEETKQKRSENAKKAKRTNGKFS